MKIRHPALIRALGFVLAWVLRLWLGTLRYRYLPLGANVDPHRRDLPERYIYAFWHENMLLPASRYARPDVYVLISQHADGQLITEVCRRLGFRAVRGSSTRGGADAVRQMMRLEGQAHLAITPDGPRGPRRRVQPGVVYLAARTGLPIVPVGVGYRRPWRARSWDRLALPRPGSVAVCVTSQVIRVPADAGRETLVQYVSAVEDALRELSDAAQEWAETGRLPRSAASQTWDSAPVGPNGRG